MPHVGDVLASDPVEDIDKIGEYRLAMDAAIAGKVGFFSDFDRKRQEEVWRLLSADRDRLLTWARRHHITIGRLEVRKSLKSPKPVYELIAIGDDARTVRQVLGIERQAR